jgi:hypothetical protein
VVALREVEARAGKHGSVELKGCHILGVEVKTVDVAIAAKIKTKKDTPAERLAAANKLLRDYKAQAIAEVLPSWNPVGSLSPGPDKFVRSL